MGYNVKGRSLPDQLAHQGKLNNFKNQETHFGWPQRPHYLRDLELLPSKLFESKKFYEVKFSQTAVLGSKTSTAAASTPLTEITALLC